MSVTIPEIPDTEFETAIERWTQDVRALLSGVMPTVVRSELMETIKEFFRLGQPWIQELGPFDLDADQRELKLNPVPDGEFVTVTPPGGDPEDILTQRVLYVRHVFFDGRVLSTIPFAGRMAQKTAETPSRCYFPYPDVIRFVPIPTREHLQSITAIAVMTPRNPEVYVPQMAWTHFYDVILDGVLAKLMAHPSKPYTNREQALFRTSRFRGSCGKVRFSASTGYGYGGSRSFFPRFGV